MTTESYQQMIVEAIRGLPQDLLAEIADFVFFVRRRAIDPEAFADERWAGGLHTGLRNMSRQEARHLEQEFEGYDLRHPRE